MAAFVVGILLFLAQQSGAPEGAKPAAPEAPEPPVQVKRADLNLLGGTDASAGESRRNENVQFNLIDNNALKYLNIRLGTNATIVTEFQPERKYFGTEFGSSPTGAIHLTAAKAARIFHGAVSFGRSDSIFSARSFFQVGGVQPAHENDYGATAGMGLWRGAHLTVEGRSRRCGEA